MLNLLASRPVTAIAVALLLCSPLSALAQSKKTAAQVVKAIQVIQGDSPIITIRSGQSLPIRVTPKTIVTTVNKVAQPAPAPIKRPAPSTSPFFNSAPAIVAQKPIAQRPATSNTYGTPYNTSSTAIKAVNLPASNPTTPSVFMPGNPGSINPAGSTISTVPLVIPPQWTIPQRYQQSFNRIYTQVQKCNKQLSPQDAYTVSKGIEVFSHYYNLDPKLVASLVTVESSFRPAAISSSGAIGLGQLKPTTAQWLGVRNPYDPLDNLLGTAKYLRFLLNKYNGSTPHALAAYYQGQGTIDRDGINDDSKYYISKIAKAFQTISTQAI